MKTKNNSIKGIGLKNLKWGVIFFAAYILISTFVVSVIYYFEEPPLIPSAMDLSGVGMFFAFFIGLGILLLFLYMVFFVWILGIGFYLKKIEKISGRKFEKRFRQLRLFVGISLLIPFILFCIMFIVNINISFLIWIFLVIGIFSVLYLLNKFKKNKK